MRIGILANEASWYYRDLERAANLLGHECIRLDFARLVAMANSQTTCIWQQRPDRTIAFHNSSNGETRTGPNSAEGLSDQLSLQCDLVIVRTMPPGSLEQVVFRMDVLARLEASGIRVVNSPKSLECAVDKYLTTARLQAAGLPIPETIVCEHEDDAMAAFQKLGSDVVVKPLFGAEGRGIVRVTDPDLAHRTFRTLMRIDSVLYLQKFVDHGGCDVRILVLDGQVLGGMQRVSPHDFRTNVAREAMPQLHHPTAFEVDLALGAAGTTGAYIAGVDLLYDRQGKCYVIEVNAVPGWQAFGRVNKIDVAQRFLKSLTEKPQIACRSHV